MQTLRICSRLTLACAHRDRLRDWPIDAGATVGTNRPKRCQLHGDVSPPKDELSLLPRHRGGVRSRQPSGVPGVLEAIRPEGRQLGVRPLDVRRRIWNRRARILPPPRPSSRTEPRDRRFRARRAAAAAPRRPRRARPHRLAARGPADAPVVAVMGGISAGRIVCDTDGDARAGGARSSGPAVRSTPSSFRVLGIDFLGGSHDTSGPAAGELFSQRELLDQALVLRSRARPRSASPQLRAASVRRTAAWWRSRSPSVIRGRRATRRRDQRRAPGAPDVHGLAQRAARDRALRARARRRARAGSRLRARSRWRPIARRASSRSAFRGPRARPTGFRFPVESYLLARGESYAARYQPESFVCLSESIDLHRVDPAAHPGASDAAGRGGGSAGAHRRRARACATRSAAAAAWSRSARHSGTMHS